MNRLHWGLVAAFSIFVAGAAVMTTAHRDATPAVQQLSAPTVMVREISRGAAQAPVVRSQDAPLGELEQFAPGGSAAAWPIDETPSGSSDDVAIEHQLAAAPHDAPPPRTARRRSPPQPAGRSPGEPAAYDANFAADEAASAEPAVQFEAEPESLAPVDDSDAPLQRLEPSEGRSRTGAFPAARPSRGDEGSGAPGSHDLEGAQAVSLSVEKSAPEEVQVGKQAILRVAVRNVGSATAQQIEIRDAVPRGTELVGAQPRAEQLPDGRLVWQITSLAPGEETAVEMHVTPLVEGEIGSVATVQFAAEASARSRSTRPVLALEASAPAQVMKGEELHLHIRLTNVGTGAASGVVLEENVPAGLAHVAGDTLEYEVGQLGPNESKELDLVLTAAQAGTVVNLLRARGDGNLDVQHELSLEVVAPDLSVTVNGPKRRYLEREATYTVSVSNPGTAPARDVQLTTYLPRGLKFVEANNYGEYDPQTRSVHWLLEELPANETGAVTLRALPVEPGEHKMVVSGTALTGLKTEIEEVVTIEGLAAILFELVDVSDPIEVGAETVYEVRVINQGTKNAANVRVMAIVPEQLRALSAEGPTRHAVEANRVVFDALPRLAPKADTTYRIRVQGQSPGDARLRVQLMTDEMRSPVTKEESTRIYSDE